MNNPNFRIGMTAPEVVVEIVNMNPGIKSLLFEVYTSTQRLEEESAIRIRTSIERMIYHDPPEKKERIWLKREEITLLRLDRITESLAEERALSVTSKAEILTGTIFHIPMMDFRCETSNENLARVEEFLRIIGQKGVILVSSKSYHFYGSQLLSPAEWSVFLGRCLLLIDPKDPRYIYTDPRYVGHRLIEGYSALRVSKELRRLNLPYVVAVT